MHRAHVVPRVALLAAIIACLPGAAPQPFQPRRFAPWIDGTSATDPELQVQMIDPDTAVIRQSVLTNFEAPFLYLVFGKDKALLLDTGAGNVRIRPTVDRLITAWQQRHQGRRIRLIVAHSHSHGDHHAGDSEFSDRPDTTVVGLKPEEVAAAFGLSAWPEQTARLDLGGRAVEIIPTPGHEPAHIMVYDARTQLLFSGDMLYPGRLYVPAARFADFRASAERLAAFARTHPIKALLGAHIELTSTPGQDYAMEAPTHPAERPLPLSPAVIEELRMALARPGAAETIDRHADFILYPRPARPAP
ncbi:MAG: MBL fold metallo-hydrolase [Novosphingobium sp.]|nr:MBL fold metallo-hydrolase [Novosphingobium sp.]